MEEADLGDWSLRAGKSLIKRIIIDIKAWAFTGLKENESPAFLVQHKIHEIPYFKS